LVIFPAVLAKIGGVPIKLLTPFKLFV
jgi:hypothetical protein